MMVIICYCYYYFVNGEGASCSYLLMVIMIKTMRRWYLRGRFSSRVKYKGGLFLFNGYVVFLWLVQFFLLFFLVSGGVVKRFYGILV